MSAGLNVCLVMFIGGSTGGHSGLWERRGGPRKTWCEQLELDLRGHDLNRIFWRHRSN